MKTLGRFTLYFTVFTFITVAVELLLYRFGPIIVLRENGVVEWLEFLWLILCSVFLFLAARKTIDYAKLFSVLWLLPLIAAVRELDGITDKMFFHGSWIVPMVIITVVSVHRIVKNFNALGPEALRFMKTQQVVFLGIGFFTVVVFAQICGNQHVLKVSFREHYQRYIGRYIEEIIEFLGYIILVIGSIDCYLQSGKSAERQDL